MQPMRHLLRVQGFSVLKEQRRMSCTNLLLSLSWSSPTAVKTHVTSQTREARDAPHLPEGPKSPPPKKESSIVQKFRNEKKCYTGVDQITTKYAGGSTHCQDNMLPRGRCFPRINPSSAPLFCKTEASPARSVFLSPCSRVNRCDAYSIKGDSSWLPMTKNSKENVCGPDIRRRPGSFARTSRQTLETLERKRHFWARTSMTRTRGRPRPEWMQKTFRLKNFDQESPRQTKPKKGPKRKVHEFRTFLVFFLGKTSAILIELWFKFAPGRVHELAFLWCGLPG